MVNHLADRLVAAFILGMACLTAAGMAAEELQPMHPGQYAEIGPEDPYQVTRVVSTYSERPQQRPKLHKNMVTLKLPSLGAKTEPRMHVVEVEAIGEDGVLNFKDARPAKPRQASASIPGLVSPEDLAIDQYRLRTPEPALARLPALPGSEAYSVAAAQPPEVEEIEERFLPPTQSEPEPAGAEKWMYPGEMESVFELPELPELRITFDEPGITGGKHLRPPEERLDIQQVELPPPLSATAVSQQPPHHPLRPPGSLPAPASMSPVEVWSLEPARDRLR